MKKLFLKGFILLAAFFLVFTSCKKEKILDDSGAELIFSEDTVQFDTVFTSVGSATEVFTVTNKYDQPLIISSIRLATGSNSYFRLNVDGLPGTAFTDIEIGANDSIWIFVEVTVDPNNLNTPLIVTDSILFTLNGNQQDVDLVAYGQDAHFFPTTACGEQRSQCTPFFKLKNCGGTGNTITWTNDKPYVIYGYAILDSGFTLTIEAGTRIHFHTNSGLVVLNTAKVIVNGTLADPVTFQGDRLGEEYKDVPGQWDRMWFSTISGIDIGGCPIAFSTGAGPSGNVFNHAIIKNGFVGIQSDSLDGNTIPAVVLNNTIMKNFASAALYGQGSFVQGNNSVFANCGEYLAAMPYGGKYRFLHCTFANYWNNGNRTSPSIYMQNSYAGVIRPIEAYFGNCIIYGNIENEVGLDSVAAPGYFNFTFDHTLFRMNNETYGSGGSHYLNSIRNVEPHFKDIENNMYEPDSASAQTSPVVDTGNLANVLLNSIVLSKDIREVVRPTPAANNPDMGAYENEYY